MKKISWLGALIIIGIFFVVCDLIYRKYIGHSLMGEYINNKIYTLFLIYGIGIFLASKNLILSIIFGVIVFSLPLLFIPGEENPLTGVGLIIYGVIYAICIIAVRLVIGKEKTNNNK